MGKRFALLIGAAALGLTVRAFARLDHAWPGPCVPSVYRRVGDFWRQTAPEPRLVGRLDATTRRRPEMRANTKRSTRWAGDSRF
jgi:hypothetical protein